MAFWIRNRYNALSNHVKSERLPITSSIKNRFNAGDSVYIFNGNTICQGSFISVDGVATEQVLKYCPGGQLGDPLLQIEFDYRLGLDIGPIGFTDNCVFLDLKEAEAAMEKYFLQNVGAREKANRLRADEARIFPENSALRMMH